MPELNTPQFLSFKKKKIWKPHKSSLQPHDSPPLLSYSLSSIHTQSTLLTSFPFSLPTHHPRDDAHTSLYHHCPRPLASSSLASPEMLLSAAWSTLAYPTCRYLPPLRSVLRPGWLPSSLLLVRRLFLKCQRLCAQVRKEARSSEKRLWPILTQHTLRRGQSGERGRRALSSIKAKVRAPTLTGICRRENWGSPRSG